MRRSGRNHIEWPDRLPRVGLIELWAAGKWRVMSGGRCEILRRRREGSWNETCLYVKFMLSFMRRRDFKGYRIGWDGKMRYSRFQVIQKNICEKLIGGRNTQSSANLWASSFLLRSLQVVLIKSSCWSKRCKNSEAATSRCVAGKFWQFFVHLILKNRTQSVQNLIG